LLGEELISDEVMAVVELVKNGYDADARKVTVTLENTVDVENGLIRIEDDGCGMDLQTVLYKWLEPATHHKRAGKGNIKKRTPLGRIQLGEKGVGRFAADKLGAELELVSRVPGASEEIVVRVGWHHYDHDRYLDEVENNWFTREPVEFSGDKHGTTLIIRSLRSQWAEELVRRVQTGLIRLLTPFSSSNDFTIEVICTDFPLMSGRVINPLLATAPYRLEGFIDENGILTIPGNTVQKIDLRSNCNGHFNSLESNYRQPCCGPFSILLNIWDLEPINKNGTGVDRNRRDAVKAFSGVSIYRDGFRIWPYGEKDDDWLELNQRRVNNPTMRISNNQIIGFVEITHKDNPDLRDRTSREGLIDTPALFDLKALVLSALSVLEVERFSLRRPVLVTPRVSSSIEEDEVLNIFSKLRGEINSGGPEITGIRSRIQEVERVYKTRLEDELTRYNQVAKLAGTGMAAELLTEAFSNDISNVQTLLNTLQSEMKFLENNNLQEIVGKLQEKMDRVNEKLDLMSPLYQSSSNETEAVNISGVIYDIASLFSHRLIETGTRIIFRGDRALEIRINRGHLMQVILIILENALSSMREAATVDPTIVIKAVFENGFAGLSISDNGPGVPANMSNLIFQPYFSTRQAGRGLGLHVARDILAKYNSSLELDESSLNGATLQIKFDGRRVCGKSE
jgi:signal transduction histidine kinase